MRRTKLLRAVFLLLLLALCGRLYYVQILCADELTAAAKSQQLIPVLQENSKGLIYDRNMKPLTGIEKVYYYLIHKDNLNQSANRLLNRMQAEPAGQKGEDYLVYRTTTYMPEISKLLQKQYRAYGFSVDARYGAHQAAAPLLADLDKIYSGLLQKDAPAFYFLGNAAGGLTHGRGMTDEEADDGTKPAALITTLDFALQQNIERIFEEADADGCAVIADTRTGQILAMVSRSKDDSNSNQAVEQAYPLGKVYGLIQTMAAAFDSKTEDAGRLLGLGTPVFAQYPEENPGSLAGKKSTATAVQMSQILITLANAGNVIPLTLVMSSVQEESLPCMEITGDAAGKLEKLREKLATEPLLGDGWAIGYEDTHAIVVHLDSGAAERVYHMLVDRA